MGFGRGGGKGSHSDTKQSPLILALEVGNKANSKREGVQRKRESSICFWPIAFSGFYYKQEEETPCQIEVVKK